MMLQTIPRTKLRDTVAESLKLYIADAGLQPGDRLPTETALAKQFGVSRLSLREATKALEFLSIVVSKPGVGLTVGHVDFQRVAGYLGFHPALRDATSVQLVEARLVIETGVLPYVVRRMRNDPSLYASLTEINDKLARSRDPMQRIELDIDFHRVLVESSGLTPLMAFSDLLSAFFQRFRENIRSSEWKKGVEGHRRVLDALHAGQTETACEELQFHIQSHLTRAQTL